MTQDFSSNVINDLLFSVWLRNLHLWGFLKPFPLRSLTSGRNNKELGNQKITSWTISIHKISNRWFKSKWPSYTSDYFLSITSQYLGIKYITLSLLWGKNFQGLAFDIQSSVFIFANLISKGEVKICIVANYVSSRLFLASGIWPGIKETLHF